VTELTPLSWTKKKSEESYFSCIFPLLAFLDKTSIPFFFLFAFSATQQFYSSILLSPISDSLLLFRLASFSPKH
jgi:hypothetical protein